MGGGRAAMHYTTTGAQNKKTMPEKCERRGPWTEPMRTLHAAHQWL